jgi:hopanoid C-3 methylase
MRILLVRPKSPNERFGLGPFFRVEPLGMEYIAAALLTRGHEVRIADLRFSATLGSLLRLFRPQLVGIASMHTVDIPSALDAARQVKVHDRSICTILGGHAAASFPDPFFRPYVDAIAVEDGERTVPAAVDALVSNQPWAEVPGLLIPDPSLSEEGRFAPTPRSNEPFNLDDVPLPARQLVRSFQNRYLVVHKTPLYAVETARGCPYRCSFCSIWPLMGRSFRVRDNEAVCQDMASVGENVFIVDDLFWHPRSRSDSLGRELLKRSIRKDFVLVQSRLDTVASNGQLLETWRPFARIFDIFFGFEAPTDRNLNALDKDFDLRALEEGVRVARQCKYGVSGNFVVDPDWEERDFQNLWDLVDRLQLSRAGYTIMTPLPGTPLYEQMQQRIVERDWSRYDMHHILFEPKLGRQRFFELFTQSWKRNVLGPRFSTRKWLGWLREVKLTQMALILRTLYQAQRNLSAKAHLDEAFPLQIPSIPQDAAPDGKLP